MRIEDALPLERASIEWHLPNIRLERINAGPSRWRFDPAVAVGLRGSSSVEIRGAFTMRERGTSPRVGMSGIGLSVSRRISAEAGNRPALALTGDVFAPAGSARGIGTSAALRAAVTRSRGAFRVHLNGLIGSFVATRPPLCPLSPINEGCRGVPTPFHPDAPCSVGVATTSGAATLCSTAPAAPLRYRDLRWLAGVGFDRDVPRHRVLLQASLFAERYRGLSPVADWYAEVGLRHQLTRTFVIDAGVADRFRGRASSLTYTLGVSAHRGPSRRVAGHEALVRRSDVVVDGSAHH
jgi:hypothetical protein